MLPCDRSYRECVPESVFAYVSGASNAPQRPRAPADECSEDKCVSESDRLSVLYVYYSLDPVLVKAG